MASSLNKVLLIGNLGKDPEIKTSEAWKQAKFSLATNESYKNKDGVLVTNTEWHNIVLWRGLAEIAEKYLKKGDKIYLEGKIRTRSYEQDGAEKRYTYIEADSLIMLDSQQQQPQAAHDQPQEFKVNLEPPTSEDDDLPF